MAEALSIIIPESEYVFREKVLTTLGRLDAKLTSLTGNGQPGRIGMIELDVRDSKVAIWAALGKIGEKLAEQSEGSAKRDGKIVMLTIFVTALVYGLIRMIG